MASLENFYVKVNRPEYKFVRPDTLLFLTGAPSSGKSTIAPLLVSSVSDLTIQNMDIIRLLAQEREAAKPEPERNPFVKYGSCDSYLFVGDGSYSSHSLIEGFKRYSEAITSLLTGVIPKLEKQGAQKVVFEGVQLTPELIQSFLNGNNRLIVLTADEQRFNHNISIRYGEDAELRDRYSVDKLLLIQDEIIKQARYYSPEKTFFIDNSGSYLDSTEQIIRLMLTEGIIS